MARPETVRIYVGKKLVARGAVIAIQLCPKYEYKNSIQYGQVTIPTGVVDAHLQYVDKPWKKRKIKQRKRKK